MVLYYLPSAFHGLGTVYGRIRAAAMLFAWQRYIYSYTHALLGVSGFLTH